ncbi:amidohydrolase family protein [Erythrobacter arachoides]|uniref:Amidohydrolase family protein n=2 Tax=Aurantiacibacter arachoides TaxID=1850444 RepID=A0A845A4I2_9SPHN|nr:amidohydrolase family protein [Aurantiacibacter arachoides]
MMTDLKTGGSQGYLRIATEEAWATQEQLDAIVRLVREGRADKGTQSLWGFYGTSPSERTTFIRERLLDIGPLRIQAMDESGIDKAVLALTSPGVQTLFDLDEARGIASRSNDQLAAACERYPDRFHGMTAICPQDADWSAAELRRGKEELGMVGVQVNSHTHGHYLDEPQFDPILRACADMDIPLYIHPQGPPDAMIGGMVEAGLEGAIFGFAMETSYHALRLLTGGVFDRYPGLKLVLGHGCEGLPFWIDRFDYMHQAGIRSGRYERMKPQRHSLHHYLRTNVWGTNSGLPSPASIRLMMEVMGEDRVLYAMDYPYQFVTDEVRLLDAMDMAPAAKRKFFQTNAEALFGI